MSDSSRSLSVNSLLVALTFALGAVVLYVTLSSEAEEAPTASPSVPDTVNTLTEAERETGWQLLFDGTSLDGWRGYQQDSVPGSWTLDEGAVHFPGESDDGGTIITNDTYDHFELRLEWKISAEGNSGIMYRVTEDADEAYKTGPEFQVLDNAVHEERDSLHKAGALYGLYAPRETVTKPVGQYNETRIVVRGDHVEHWMNGTKLLEAELGVTTGISASRAQNSLTGRASRRPKRAALPCKTTEIRCGFGTSSSVPWTARGNSHPSLPERSV